MIARPVIIVVAAALVAAPAWAQTAQEYPTAPPPKIVTQSVDMPSVTGGAATMEDFDSRIEADADRMHEEYPKAHFDRYVTDIIAYPRNLPELASLKGNSLLLIAAFSLAGADLPVSRVYLAHADGSQTMLTKIGTASREVPPTSDAGVVFGTNRQDSVYLLPVKAMADAQLQCDFKSRSGFVIAKSLDPPAELARVALTGGLPPASIVMPFMAREFPGFGIVAEEGVLP